MGQNLRVVPMGPNLRVRLDQACRLWQFKNSIHLKLNAQYINIPS